MTGLTVIDGDAAEAPEMVQQTCEDCGCHGFKWYKSEPDGKLIYNSVHCRDCDAIYWAGCDVQE